MADAAEPFLRVDGLPEAQRKAALAALAKGEFVIDSLETTDAGRTIDVPDGLIHHWAGVVFVPGANVNQAVALLQDYDQHGVIYKPNVARSKLIERDGDRFKTYLRFFMKKFERASSTAMRTPIERVIDAARVSTPVDRSRATNLQAMTTPSNDRQ